MSQKTLIVALGDKALECYEEGSIGMYNMGCGKTIAEAVGDFCIFSGLVKVRCDPPELLKQYQAKKVKKFKTFPRRGN